MTEGFLPQERFFLTQIRNHYPKKKLLYFLDVESNCNKVIYYRTRIGYFPHIMIKSTLNADDMTMVYILVRDYYWLYVIQSNKGVHMFSLNFFSLTW